MTTTTDSGQQARSLNTVRWVLALATVGLIFDGYDLVVYGAVVSTFLRDASQIGTVTPPMAGALGSYALFGMMFGALFFGPLSDRIGRKKVIALCVILFSFFTFLNGFARDVLEFGVCRFIAGLGIGGVMPNVVALMTEYAPKKIRNLLVTIMFSGYSVGGMLSAGLGMWLVPDFGWASVFFVAIIPLVLLPVIWKLLPESPGFLSRGNQTSHLANIVKTLNPNFKHQPDDVFVYPIEASNSTPLVALFKDGRTLTTIMFWVSFFMCLLMVYALGSWLPKLMNQAGYPLGSSIMFLMVLFPALVMVPARWFY